jgi:hypothetical protein
VLTNFKDFSVGTVSTGYTSGATAIAMSAGDGAKLPVAPFFAYWWNSTDYATPELDPNRELIYVGTRAGDNLSNIQRGQGDDAASNKNTAAKTYKLMATVSAKEFESRSRIIGQVGPTANITFTVGSVEIDLADTITIPANYLKAGDVIEWKMVWQHNAGSYASAPRLALRMGSVYLIGNPTAIWSATETIIHMEGTISIREAGASGAMLYSSAFMRENATLACERNGATSIDTTAAQVFTPSYRMDASGETIILSRISIILHRN